MEIIPATIPQEFEDHELIETSSAFWFLGYTVTDRHHGWALPIYYDFTSKVYRVFNDRYGLCLEIKDLPPIEEVVEFENPTPVQHARDIITKTVMGKIKTRQ